MSDSTYNNIGSLERHKIDSWLPRAEEDSRGCHGEYGISFGNYENGLMII